MQHPPKQRPLPVQQQTERLDAQVAVELQTDIDKAFNQELLLTQQHESLADAKEQIESHESLADAKKQIALELGTAESAAELGTAGELPGHFHPGESLPYAAKEWKRCLPP